MRFSSAILAAACATAALAENNVKPRALLTIEVAPGVTRQITEEDRYELGKVGLGHRFDLVSPC